MHRIVTLIVVLASAPGGLRAAPSTEPVIELITMGQGPRLFHRFGHAALCVVYRRQPARTRCFNYGTANFHSPPQTLGWRFLRGTAQFWVSTSGRGYMLKVYRDHDRSVWSQRLPLPQAQVDAMVRRLEHDILPAHRNYTYHHFDDNCSTRLRDHIDAVTGGALRRGSGRTLGVSLRDMGRRGLADQTLLIVMANLTLGRRLDGKVTVWEAMFHPDHLRAHVARQLGARPVQLYKRRGPPLPQEGSQGHEYYLLLALLLALPVLVTRIWGRLERLAIGLATVPLTLIALALWFVAVVTTVREMQINEALLLFWPTDLLLVILGPRRRRIYASVRVAWLGLAILLWLVGVLVQPLAVAALVPALPCAVILWRGRQAPPAPAPEPEPEPEQEPGPVLE